MNKKKQAGEETPASDCDNMLPLFSTQVTRWRMLRLCETYADGIIMATDRRGNRTEGRARQTIELGILKSKST